MDIRFIGQEEIDKTKWNSCVHYASNGNVFGYHWYLQHVAKAWDALIEGDYESVFPLVWKKNWWQGKTLYQPYLMRELGLYSINVLSPARLRRFLQAIPEEFSKIHIVLNAGNTVEPDWGFQVRQLTNHFLVLNETYETIASHFTPQSLEWLDRAENAGLLPVSNLKPEKVAAFYKKYHPDRRQIDARFHALQRIMYNALHRGWGFASGITDKNDNLLAVDFYLYSHSRVLRLAPAVSPEGLKVGAHAMLTNLLIQSHAGRPLVLDFNTDRPDDFARSLGAEEIGYWEVRRG